MNIDKYQQNTYETVDERDSSILAQVAEGEVYRKSVIIGAIQVTEQTPVETILADGTKETTNVAETGDYIAVNPGGEEYVIKNDKFADLYEATDEPGKFQAKGIVKAIKNPTDKWVQIKKSWGTQEGAPDSMFAVTYNPENNELVGSMRIIGAQEFADTYEPIEQAAE